MKRTLLIVLVSCAISILMAQDSSFVGRHLFTKDHITFSIGGVLREPGVAIPTPPYTSNDPTPKSFWGAGLRLDLNYTFNLGRRIGFEAGFAATAYKEAISILHDSDWRSSLMFGIWNWHSESRIRAFYRFKVSSKIWLQPYWGASLVTYKPCDCSFSESRVGGNRGYVLINTGTDISHYLYTTPGVATLFLLPNEDMLRIGLTGNFVADGRYFKVSYGSYLYQDPQNQLLSRGIYDIRGNYFALDIGYTFTRTRELRRNLEEEFSGTKKERSEKK